MQPTLPIAHCRRCGQPLLPHPHQVCTTCLAALAKDAVGAAHTHVGGAISPAQLEALEKVARTIEGYEILERVGVGGMGVVFRARQTRLGRVVAIKMLPSSDDEQLSSRFSREARAMAALAHPHIVTVHDFGISGGHPYLVMEFVEGPNLRQLLATGALHAKAALALVPDLCDALSYAHERGVVHRDIKPENILFTRDGRPKVADFGLAKISGPTGVTAGLTASRMTMGTPQYMAPEQWESARDVDHRADIYALGVMIYEMLTHELPLGRFEPPSRHAAIDARMDEVVMRALERDPQRRYQHARELSSAIKELARNAVAEAVGVRAPRGDSGPLPILAAAPREADARGPGPRPAAPDSRGGIPRWATALFVAVLLAVGALLPWFGEPATAPADGRLAVGERTWISSSNWSESWGLHQLTLEVRGVEIHGLLGTVALAGGLLLWMARSPFSLLASTLGLACYGALVHAGSRALVVRHGALVSLAVAGAWTIAIGFEYLRTWWLRSHAIEVRWGILATGIAVALGVVLAIPGGPSHGPEAGIAHAALLVLILGTTAFLAMRRPSSRGRVLSPGSIVLWILVGLGTMMGLGAVVFLLAGRPMEPSHISARAQFSSNTIPAPVPTRPLPPQVAYTTPRSTEAIVAMVRSLIDQGELERAREALDELAAAGHNRDEVAALVKIVGDAARRRDDATKLFAEGRGAEALQQLGDEPAFATLRGHMARIIDLDGLIRSTLEGGDADRARDLAAQLLSLDSTPSSVYVRRAREVLALTEKKGR